MKLHIPIFRRFRHDELKKVGIPNGEATDAVLQEIVDNTNRLISLGVHRPDHRETHDGSILSDDSLGWSDKLVLKDGVIYSETDVTPKGAEKKSGKLLRWVSSGIKRDFDSGDEKVRGLYLDHVAWLGRTKPKIKGLVDLSTAAAFSEEAGEGGLLVDPETNAFALFSENRDADTEEDMAENNIEGRLSQLEAKLSEQGDKLKTAEAKLSEVETERDTAREELETLKTENTTLKESSEKAVKEAKLSEIKSKVDASNLGVQAKQALLADAKEAIDSGNDIAVRMVEKSVERSVKAAARNLPGASAMFSDEDEDKEETRLTEAHFSEAYEDEGKMKEIMAFVNKKRATNKDYSFADAKREICG